jgi:hypothetical protein
MAAIYGAVGGAGCGGRVRAELRLVDTRVVCRLGLRAVSKRAGVAVGAVGEGKVQTRNRRVRPELRNWVLRMGNGDAGRSKRYEWGEYKGLGSELRETNTRTKRTFTGRRRSW